MKKILLTLFGLMLMFSGNVFGQVATFDFDNDYATIFPKLPGVSSSSATDGDFTATTTSTAVNGYTVTVSVADEGKTANRIWSGAPRLRMYSGTFTVTGKGMTKIVFTGHNTNFNLSTQTGTLNEKEWTGNADEIVFAVAKNTQINKIVIYAESSTPSTKTATTIEFSGDYETRATCGKDESVSLPTAIVKAGDAAVTGATVTWESNKTDIATVNGNKLMITNGTQGEVTIKATFAGNDTYEASTKTYKLTVYKGALLLSSLVEDVYSTNEKWDNGGEYVSYWFVDLDNGMISVPNTVTYANGKYTYLTDGTNNLLFYGTNTLGLKQGDVISGDLGDGKMGAVWGKLYRYNKLPEFSFTEMDVKVQSEGATVTPKTITADILNENINAYVKIEGAKFVSANNRNLTFLVGENSLAVYNQFNVNVDALEENAIYTLIGMGSVYNTTYQLNPISFEKTADDTAISSVVVGQKDAPIFNVSGQLLSAPQRGINIIGGRKVFVK